MPRRLKMELFQKLPILISVIGLLFEGCTQEALYETFRHSDKYNCHDNPNPQERIKCFEAPRPSYESYKEYLDTKENR